MAVAMRDRWTDERLDDLNGKVDDGFRRVDERFDRVDERFERMDVRFDRVDEKFERMEERFVRTDERFGRIEERFAWMEEKVGQRFDDQNAWIRAEFGQVNARIDSLSRTILQGAFALCAAMIAMAAATLAAFVAAL
ncbi:MAG: hypothetical protein AB7V58_09315 [Solirubrobacterales bacterium]